MAIPDYNEILERMLARVPDEYDKREGSPIYIALAPAAFELQRVYALVSTTEDNAFADTADYYYLQRRAAERGLAPYPATNAIVKGEFNIDVDIGARFSLLNSAVNYYVTEKRENGEHAYNLACETAGESGNISSAELVPIQEIEGLTSANITGIVVNGEDMESEDDFRARYFSSITDQSFGGNKAAYKEYVNGINGVGACKIYPCYNGGGTVKVTIMNTEMGAASTDLISSVQTALDPGSEGQGLGWAPIGHSVLVDTVTIAGITITVDKSGLVWEDSAEDNELTKDKTEAAVGEYFSELTNEWAENDDDDAIVIRVSQIKKRLLDTPALEDIGTVKINGFEANLTLSNAHIPVYSALVVEE